MTEINLRCEDCRNGVFLEEGKGACSKCGRAYEAAHLPSGGEALSRCGVCGRRDLFRQRDFNRSLGALIATAACLTAFVLFVKDLWFPALAVLVGAAAVDLGLYLLLPEVAVCYACAAIHSGFAMDAAIGPYRLIVADSREKRAGGPVA